MRNLIFIIVLMPFMAFSQVIMPEVTKVCFYYWDSPETDCYEANETFSIELVDNEYFLFKSNGKIKKYPIIGYYIHKDTKEDMNNFFDIDFDGEKYNVSILIGDDFKDIMIHNKKECLVYTYKKREL
jgi:hypothetical protein